jgi:hypothetical protein
MGRAGLEPATFGFWAVLPSLHCVPLRRHKFLIFLFVVHINRATIEMLTNK